MQAKEPRMNHYRRAMWCAAAVFMLSLSLARAADPDWMPPEEVEAPPGTAFACDAAAGCACDLSPSCAATPLGVFVPNLNPGVQFTASFLQLKPGADNLGFATITTFLPLQNPQWAVQALNTSYQPGFAVGARQVFACSGKDIQTNWEHLRTSDSSSVAVSDLTTQWISPFNQTGPSTSEQANQVGIFHFKAAQGQVNFDYDMVNLDVGQTVNVGLHTQLRLFAGLSWVRLQEQL